MLTNLNRYLSDLKKFSQELIDGICAPFDDYRRYQLYLIQKHFQELLRLLLACFLKKAILDFIDEYQHENQNDEMMNILFEVIRIGVICGINFYIIRKTIELVINLESRASESIESRARFFAHHRSPEPTDEHLNSAVINNY